MKKNTITLFIAMFFTLFFAFSLMNEASAKKKFHIKVHKEFKKKCKNCHSQGKKLKKGITVKSLLATQKCAKCHKK